MSSRDRLFLIDGSSQMYRAYHAIRSLTAPDGRPSNAVFGFVSMLRKLIADHHPALIAAAFDLEGPTFRSDLAADYKANRAPMPPDLVAQVDLVHEACAALGVPVLTHDRYEADDVIGTLARHGADAGFDVVIVTGDKDFFQLVRPGVLVYNPRDEGTWFDEEGVERKFGVRPDRVVDVLALMGDSVDNVKGVPGIGEKGARDLITTFGSLDALLERTGEVAQKRYREALVEHADAARHSRELVTIHVDVPVEVDLPSLRYTGPDRARSFALFSSLGFRTLTAEFAPTAAQVSRDYQVVDTRDQLTELAREMTREQRVALHVVSTGNPPRAGRVVGLAISKAPRTARYVPIAHDEPGGLFDTDRAVGVDASTVVAVLGPPLEDPTILKVGHDLKAAALALASLGITLEGMGDDTMLASYVLDATRGAHSLEALGLEHAGYQAADEDSVRGRGAKAVGFDALPVDAVFGFAGERADLAGQVAPALVARLEHDGLATVYRDLELPLVAVLASLERAGIRVDLPALATLAVRVDGELGALTARIHEMAGETFNINSPKQLSDILFEKLALPVSKKTGKTRTASTSVEVLEELAAVHPLPRAVVEWRALSKLKGTYIDALPLMADPVTSRVHTSFNQAVAATGRLSSSDPNLQNIPIRTELGREIRRAFVAEPGSVLISADYSQIELRVLAHLSGDEALVEAFREGQDIHDRTAAAVFGEASGIDPYELRRRAKIINYALLYGKTAFTLAKDIGVTQAAAQEFIDAYFAGFPGVRRFIDALLARARETGVVSTLAGRRRLVPDITSSNGQVRSAAERVAVNMPIQGTAADILKRAMIDLHEAIARFRGDDPLRARMILTVHDELLFEVREADADEVAALVRTKMEGAAALDVPLTVDVGIGPNWADAKA